MPLFLIPCVSTTVFICQISMSAQKVPLAVTMAVSTRLALMSASAIKAINWQTKRHAQVHSLTTAFMCKSLIGTGCCPSLDIDECLESTDDCEFICENTIGGYQCWCPLGHILALDNRSCEGIYYWVVGILCRHRLLVNKTRHSKLQFLEFVVLKQLHTILLSSAFSQVILLLQTVLCFCCVLTISLNLWPIKSSAYRISN